MKKFFLALVLAVSPALSWAWKQPEPLPVEQCHVHTPWGIPQAHRPLTYICRLGYLVAHDNKAKISAWAAHTLTPDHAIGCVPRDDAFNADASLPPGQRAELKDYAGSGYDMGHQVPDGDLSWSTETEQQSFLLSNMVPQLPGLNRGIWKLLETSVRGWASQRGHTLTVYTGPIYLNSTKTIGPGQVVVPDAFFKIVVDHTTRETLAFGFPHSDKLGKELDKRQTTVAEIEQLTGINFPVPGSKSQMTPIWPVDFGKLTNDKRSKCKN